ncbi:MAG: adenylate kinase family protein, partial [Candidatus Aenigmatarchaeota archaeon]
KIVEDFEMTYIGMGDLLRKYAEKDTELGKRIDKIIDRGDLVPLEMLKEVLENKIKDIDDGIIFDGVPRSVEQAKKLEEIVDIDKVIYLDIPKDLSIKRLSNRRQCKNCDEIYNKITKPPEEEGVCDKCGGKLYQREDDKPKVIKNRLETFNEETKPLIDYYENKGILEKVDGTEPIEKIYQRIKEILKK